LIVVEVVLLVWGEFGSLVADAFAVLDTSAGDPAVTEIVKMSLLPASRSAPEQVTVPLLFTHPAEAETKVTPAGKMSVAETPVAVAAADAELVIVIV
jgi:hypothetical protein